MQGLGRRGATPLDEKAALYRGRGGRRPRFARTSLTLLALIVVSAFVYTQLAPKSALGRTLQDAAARLREGWQQTWPTLEQQLGNITELAKESQSGAKTYSVQPGDSLSKIATRFGIPWQALIAANQDRYPSLTTNPSLIQVGWQITVPAKEEARVLAQSVTLPAQTPAPTATPVAADAAPTQVVETQAATPVRVLVLAGHIDEMDGPETQEGFQQARTEVEKLRQMGFDVFYCEAGSCHWSDLLQQAWGAKALIYHGHGIYRGDPYHPETVGGFNLAPGEFVAKEQIANDLRVMSPGWVAVLPTSCFAAGSSGPEWETDIGLDEAERRVAIYSEDFLAGGAACYFAGDNPVTILRSLSRGSTCSEAASFNLYSSQLKFSHPAYPNAALWLARWGVNYASAFVGDPQARPLGQ